MQSIWDHVLRLSVLEKQISEKLQIFRRIMTRHTQPPKRLLLAKRQVWSLLAWIERISGTLFIESDQHDDRSVLAAGVLKRQVAAKGSQTDIRLL